MLLDRSFSLLRMTQLLFQRREPAVVRRDASGGWRHRYSRGVLVTPRLRGPTWKAAESDTFDLFLYRYQPRYGDVVLEIGAGCGTETVFLASRVGSGGRVVAVEAHPWTYQLLCRTIIENRLNNVTPVHAVVTDQRGTISISGLKTEENIINSVLGDQQGWAVPSVSVDDLVRDHGLDRIDLLTMNIQGAERLAVEGMSASAARIGHAVVSCHDFLADRTGNEMYRTSDHVRAALEQCGFTIEARPDDHRVRVRDHLYAYR
jgi:FkbM family methyltransferase